MSLDSILDATTVRAIGDAKKRVFHAVGDTGGVNTPTYVEAVARFMEADVALLAPPNRPSFFYHLGDVVYYDGSLRTIGRNSTNLISTITPRSSPFPAILTATSILQWAIRASRPSFAISAPSLPF